jgi:hypothetical protein
MESRHNGAVGRGRFRFARLFAHEGTAMASRTYSGSCHCGAVRFEADIDFDVTSTVRCNCSICAKVRAWFALVPPDRFRLLEGDDVLTEYHWTPPGQLSVNLRYRFCRTCGVRVFARGEDDGEGNAFYAISVATLDDPLPEDLVIAYVDGLNGRYDRTPENTDLI